VCFPDTPLSPVWRRRRSARRLSGPRGVGRASRGRASTAPVGLRARAPVAPQSPPDLAFVGLALPARREAGGRGGVSRRADLLERHGQVLDLTLQLVEGEEQLVESVVS